MQFKIAMKDMHIYKAELESKAERLTKDISLLNMRQLNPEAQKIVKRLSQTINSIRT